jgi:hypothetical protein
VEVARADAAYLSLRYVARGSIADVAVPAPSASKRTDELWKHTCFEAFVRAPGGEAYREFNFSPSTQWAAYAFDGYRVGMRALEATPHIEVRRDPQALELLAVLRLGARPWRLALSAVIEEVSGRRSYWALAHPPGKPDFHHADSFAIELPAAESA